MRRLLRRYWWALAILVIAGAPIAWYLGSPLFINKVVDEPFPTGTGAPAGAAQGVVFARGTFAGADDFHKGEGTATLSRAGGDLILRLDAFKVTNGPDLHVVLTKHAAPKKGEEVLAGYVDIGKLKGNVGGQNYRLPQGVNPGEYHAVVIYCKPFNFIFAVAPLK